MITVEQNGQSNEVSYDKLFLSPGGKPVTPPVDGIDQYNNVLFMRGREWAIKLNNVCHNLKSSCCRRWLHWY